MKSFSSLCGLCMASFLLLESITKINSPIYAFLTISVFAILSISLVIYTYFRNRTTAITVIDLLLGIGLLANLPALLRQGHLSATCMLVSFYILSRNVINVRQIGYILTITGCWQVVLMGLQSVGWLSSAHVYFSIIGSFDNPGPLGGYLMVCLLATISQRHSYPKGIWFLISFLLLLGLIQTHSRAAWMGAVIGLGFYCMQKFRIGFLWQIIIFIGVILGSGLYFLHGYKADSAQGRLAIWKVSATMIKESPFVGHGLGSFSQQYMYYQSRYIQTEASETEICLLGNTKYAFNEFIHIAVEQGSIGLTTIIVVLLWLMRAAYRKKEKKTLVSCLLGLSVFACFSYPFEVLPLLTVCIILCGNLSGETQICFSLTNKFQSKVCTLLSVFIVVILITDSCLRLRLEHTLTNFYYYADTRSLNYIEANSWYWRFHPDFVMRYARILYLKEEYEKAIPVLLQARKFYPSTQIHIDLGNAYQITGQYAKAQEMYQMAEQLLSKSSTSR